MVKSPLGEPGEKALPSGFTGIYAGFSFSRRVCWLQREGRPWAMGDLLDSFSEDEFHCLQWENHMLLSLRRVGTVESHLCPTGRSLPRYKWEWASGLSNGHVVLCFSPFRFTSTIAVSQKRKFLMSTVLERNCGSSSCYTSCRHMTMR